MAEARQLDSGSLAASSRAPPFAGPTVAVAFGWHSVFKEKTYAACSRIYDQPLPACDTWARDELSNAPAWPLASRANTPLAKQI